MIDERHEELASLYALDLLERAERAQFETALARDPELQGLVQELSDAAAALAHIATAPPPPAALKERVLASIGGSSASADNIIRPRAFAFGRFAPWAIAACLALVAAWMSQRYLATHTEATLLRGRQEFTGIALTTMQQQLEAERIINSQQIRTLDQQLGEAKGTIAQLTAEMKTQGDIANLKIAALASLSKNSPEALAIAIWDPAKQEGMFAFEKMPPLGADQKFELWVVEAKDGAKPVSAGVMNVSADGTARVRFKPTAPVTAIAAFAVSREKNDGATFHAAPAEVIMLGNSR